MTQQELQALSEKVAKAAMSNDMDFLKRTLKELIPQNDKGEFGPMGLEWFFSSLTSSQVAELSEITAQE